jgi:uncharacterized phiE125 gp8 family phage protein
MRLIETGTLTQADFPISALKDQLRLGTGFSDSGAQDTLLESCLRAAMGAIEARTQKILILRRFLLIRETWRLEGAAQPLPVSPVTYIQYVRMVAGDKSWTDLDAASYRLIPDDQRPKLAAVGKPLPQIEEGGTAEIMFLAGFGAWAQIPAVLQQAMLMLAASYYENRESMINGGGQIPFGVSALLEPYKRFRLGAGL